MTDKTKQESQEAPPAQSATEPYQDAQHCRCTQEYIHRGWLGRERRRMTMHFNGRRFSEWTEILHTQDACEPTGRVRVTTDSGAVSWR